MHTSAAVFVAKSLSKSDIEGQRVLEVGSRNVNGSVRPLIKSYDPEEYIGIDIEEGDSVDQVLDATEIVDHFGEEWFDVVISTEMLEHARDWEETVSNMKSACATGGLLVITTRSIGYNYHAYPHDYWRYEISDMREIFSDMNMEILESDSMQDGVFLKARKPTQFIENDLTNYELYSMITGERVGSRTVSMPDGYLSKFRIRHRDDSPKEIVRKNLAKVFDMI